MDTQTDNQRFDASHRHPAIDAWFKKQHGQIRELMLDERWRTLAEIEGPTGVPKASVYLHLLLLSGLEFGGYVVEKRFRGQNAIGASEFRVSAPDELFGPPLESFSELKGRQALSELRDLVTWAKDRGYPIPDAIIRLGRWMRCVCGPLPSSSGANGHSRQHVGEDDAQYRRILAQHAWVRELEEQLQAEEESGELTA